MSSEALERKITEANDLALNRLLAGRPVWTDVRPAIEVLPNMAKRTVLHAGPPIEWERMCGPQRLGIINAVIFEGLANSTEEALGLIEGGEIEYGPCHDSLAVGGMAGITSASQPMIVVRNETFGNEGYSQLYQGPGVYQAQLGDYDSGARRQWNWLADVLGPALGAAIRARGGLEVKPLIAKALQMGDECHNRNSAGTGVFLQQMMPWLLKADLPIGMIRDSVRYLSTSEQFFLCVAMASAKAVIDPVKGIDYSTLVTTLSRNGVDFGIKVSALGERWFAATANKVDGLYFSSEWSDEDAVLDMGDSAIMETVGLGGHVQATAPALQQFVGGSFARAAALTREMELITVGFIQDFQLPNLDFAGAPVGIDIRKVVARRITPIIDTAIAHKRGGVIGAGQVRAPRACFTQALEAFKQHYRSEFLEEEGKGA